MLSPFPNSSVGFMRGGGAVMPGIVGFQIASGAVVTPSPSPGPMGPAGGPLEREYERAKPYDDAAAKRHAKIMREDEEILELIVQVVTKGMLD